MKLLSVLQPAMVLMPALLHLISQSNKTINGTVCKGKEATGQPNSASSFIDQTMIPFRTN